jgi:SAM-dependent methyltransferase
MPTLINRLASYFSAPCDEPEYRFLEHLAMDGACVIEVGAGVGQYTRRLSELVGASGRVIAVESDHDTFALLAANAASLRNVMLLNSHDLLPALLGVGLVKVAVAGGREFDVLLGLQKLIERDRPLLIVRTEIADPAQTPPFMPPSTDTLMLLKSWGYAVRRMPGSRNVIAEVR